MKQGKLRLFLNSLSFRLTFFSTFMTFLLILSFWFFLYKNLDKNLDRQQQDILSDRLRTIQNLLLSQGDSLDRLKQRIELEWANRKFEKIFVQISNEHGQLISETPNLNAQEKLIFENPEYDYSQNFRVARNQIVMAPLKKYTVVMALDRSSDEDLLRRFRQSLAFVAIFGLVLCFLLAQFLTRTSVRAIQKMSTRITEVNSSTLKERVHLGDVPVEFHELGKNVNEMLERIEKSFTQLSQFSDDMAHEIRTPINNLLGVLGVTISQRRTSEEYQNALISSLEEGERLKKIVDSLMFIARTKDPKMHVQMQNFELNELISEVVEFYQAMSEAKDVKIIITASKTFSVRAERLLAQRAVANLLANAIRYSPEKSVVEILLRQTHTRVFVSVKDHGPGIAANDLKYVGDRFFRVDDSRAKHLGGTGLGLSIVKSIAHIHDSNLQVESQVGSGTTMTIDFLSQNKSKNHVEDHLDEQNVI